MTLDGTPPVDPYTDAEVNEDVVELEDGAVGSTMLDGTPPVEPTM